MFFKPPTVLRPTENQSEEEGIEIGATKLLLRSYYDIVRKNIEDSVPKAIMHFLVFSFSFPYHVIEKCYLYLYVERAFIVIKQL